MNGIAFFFFLPFRTVIMRRSVNDIYIRNVNH